MAVNALRISVCSSKSLGTITMIVHIHTIIFNPYIGREIHNLSVYLLTCYIFVAVQKASMTFAGHRTQHFSTKIAEQCFTFRARQ